VRNDLLMIYGRILLLMVHAKHSRAEADIQRSPINEKPYAGVAPYESMSYLRVYPAFKPY